MHTHAHSVGLGRYSHYRYTIDTEINQYVSIRSSCYTSTDDGDRPPKTTTNPDPELCVLHLTFIQLSKRLKHIEFTLIMLNEYFVNKTMVSTTQVIILL